MACAFTRDGRRVVSASWDKTLRLWDAATGRQIGTLPTPYSVLSIAMHPDRTRLAFGNSGGIVALVDIHDAGGGGQ
jgi:WD40 repeat protein